MLTMLLRNIVVNIRHNVSFNNNNVRDFCHTAQRQAQLPYLSPYDVNVILHENEFTHTFQEENSSIRSYETSQLGSNTPCEDCRTEASFVHKNGFLCGIFDGHAGPSCSQVVSKRMLRYVAASLVDRDTLKKEIQNGCNSQSFLKCYNDKVDFVKEIKDIYEESFSKYIKEISSHTLKDRVSELENAFVQLDNDISNEALEHKNIRTMAVAMSGAVACLVHLQDLDLHVANTGDCSAVLGTQCPDTGRWQAKKLTVEHNTDNHKEVQRILEKHPKEEHETAIRNDRLLGQLAPLRALGDFRYKWSNETMTKYVTPLYGEQAVPPHYYTPPYLTAQPEVQHHVLGQNDKFLVIGSDGLWDFLSPSQVVNIVSQHMSSKKNVEPLKFSENNVMNLQDVANILAKRKAGRSRKPLDENAATHLIRNALGGTDYGIEHSKLSYYLSLPRDVVRLYRDDITITIIYFNTDYIAKHTKTE